MNGQWNLEVLYKGFDDPQYVADFGKMEEKLQGFAVFADGIDGIAPAEGLRESISRQEELEEIIMKLISYASLRQSANTRDQEAGSQMGRIMAAYSAANDCRPDRPVLPACGGIK